jgi:hypothetical protein
LNPRSGEPSRLVSTLSRGTPEQVLLGPLGIGGPPGTRGAVDLDDVLARTARVAVTQCAWDAARRWYRTHAAVIQALGWLAEYRTGRRLLGLLRVVASLRRYQEERGPRRWAVPDAAGGLLVSALGAAGIEALPARGNRLPEPPAYAPHRVPATLLRRPWRRRSSWLALGGGGVNELLEREGARGFPIIFLDGRLPPRRILLRLAFGYDLLSTVGRTPDLDPALGHLAAAPGAGSDARATKLSLGALASMFAPIALKESRAELRRAIQAGCAALGWLRDRGRGVLTPDDALPYTRAIVAMAALAGRPAVVVQHGAIVAREDRNHQVAGSSLAWGPVFHDVLRREMGSRHHPWVMGHPGRLPARVRDRHRDIVLFLGTAGHAITLEDHPRHQQDVLDALVARLVGLGRPVDLVIRPHYSDEGALRLLATASAVRTSVARLGTLSDALRGVAVMVTTISTGVVEAALSGVPVVACPETVTELIAGMRGIPGVHWSSTPAEAADLACSILVGTELKRPVPHGPAYVSEFVGWTRLARHLDGLNAAFSEAEAVGHAHVLARLMGEA